MSHFTTLSISGDSYMVNNKKPFSQIAYFRKQSIETVFNFAYDMSFGKRGQHRNHRSGGSHRRTNGEIFVSVLQGKLAEMGIYNYFYKDYEISPPDFNVYGLGEWDDQDFILNDKKISVKSARHFSNLLMLETKDWNDEAQFIPNLNINRTAQYDIYILVRIKTDILIPREVLRKNEIMRSELEKMVFDSNWSYDIAGFFTHEDLLYVINNQHIIPKGVLLNGTTPMDAENYYIQSGDMRDISTIHKHLTKVSNKSGVS